MVRPAASSATGKSAVDHSYPHQSHELPPLGLDQSLEDSWHHESNTAPFLKGKRGGTENQDVWGKQIIIWNGGIQEKLQKSKGTCKGRPSGLSTVPCGAHTLNFHCSVQSNFKCLKQKALLPLQNLTNHLCLLHDCLFLNDSSFNFVFSWYSTVPLDKSAPKSNFFLKAFVPLHCLLSRKKLS